MQSDKQDSQRSTLPNFQAVDADELIDVALSDLPPTEASQDLVRPGAGANSSQCHLESRTVDFPGSAQTNAAPHLMSTQELDSELRRLPIGSEPLIGSEAPPVTSFCLATASDAAGVGPPSEAPGSDGHADSAPASSPPQQQQQPIQPQQHSDGGLSLEGSAPTFDTAALDDELRALPIHTQEQEPSAMDEDCEDAGNAQPSGPAHVPSQSLVGHRSAGATGGFYMNSQALDDALRALPIGSSVENELPPPPPSVGSSQGQGGNADAPHESDTPTGFVSPAQTAAAAVATEKEGPGRQPHPASQQPGSARVVPAPSSGFGSNALHDFDDATFDDDLDDYLRAQAAEEQQVTDAPAPTRPQQLPPQQQQHNTRPEPQPYDEDELDDLIAELEYSRKAEASQQQQQQRSCAAAAAAGSRLGPSAGGQRQGLDTHDAVRQAKRPRTEAQGRPTMEELFGSDDEDVVAVAAGGAAGPSTNGVAAGRQSGKGAGGAGASAGAEKGWEEAPVEPEEEAVRRSQYFPPQRLAARIEGGIVLPVTAASGERVYCRMDEQSVAAGVAPAPPRGHAPAAGRHARGHRGGCLLDKPMSEMLRELEERQLRAAVAASEREERRKLHQSHHYHHHQHFPREDTDGFTEAEREFAGMAAGGRAWAADGAGPSRRPVGRRVSGAAAAAAHDNRAAHGLEEEAVLWVDKYAPRHFTALLSDERTNRQVALWVKDWDECVFGRAGGAAGELKGRPAGPAGRKADSRPQHKVLLIGGPPGLGKTTLAHVVARHCGYHPYEINASDDRTASTLLTKIQDAVQMTAVLGGGKPNCVIVDEVDGATGGSETGGAVAALLKLVRAGEGSAAGGAGGKGGGTGAAGGRHDDEDSDGDNEAGGDDAGGEGRKAGKKKGAGGGGRKGAQARPLCRPIICICNDLYAPALRPLRDVARVFHFSPPATERLVARLEQICRAERLEADPAALRLLVERTDRDVRACLNTVQFLARRAGGAGGDGRCVIDMKDIESLNIASKDTTQSAMDMWGMLLSTGHQIGHPGAVRKRALAAGGPGGQVGEICNRLQDFGDYDLVINGLHENLPRVRFMDINLSRTAAVAETLGHADILLRTCRRTGDFSCLRFVPPCLAKVRALAAQPERPRQLAWPKLGTEAARRASAATQLVRSWASGGSTDAAVLSAYGMRAMTLELAPALRTLVSQPPVRAVAPHMMNPEEQAALRRTATTMLHYGLRYCFEQPPPPGLQPLQLPEVAEPVSSNAIILGLTSEVQRNIAAAAAGGSAQGDRGGFQRPQGPYGGGRGPYGRGPGSGRGAYKSYGQGRGPGGGPGAVGRGPCGPDGSAALGSAGAGVSAPLIAGTAAVRHVPLVPAIDTLHCFTAFAGSGAGGARVTVPVVVRQMVSQQTEMEAIRRAEALRTATLYGNAGGQPAADPALPRGPAAAAPSAAPVPLQPVCAPPQRQMAGRLPPPAEGKKGPDANGGAAKRKGTWMDAFKQQASAKARGGVGGGVSAGALARKGDQAAAGAEDGGGGDGKAPAAARASAASAGKAGRLPFPVLYRFNEGYTNAVKRPLLMRELL